MRSFIGEDFKNRDNCSSTLSECILLVILMNGSIVRTLKLKAIQQVDHRYRERLQSNYETYLIPKLALLNKLRDNRVRYATGCLSTFCSRSLWLYPSRFSSFKTMANVIYNNFIIQTSNIYLTYIITNVENRTTRYKHLFHSKIVCLQGFVKITRTKSNFKTQNLVHLNIFQIKLIFKCISHL